jgi:hypothetical protein
MSDDSILELVSKVTELNDLSDNMNDSTLDEALALVLKLIVKPDVPAKHAAPLIVQFQAMSMKFKMQAKDLMIFDKSAPQAAQRKNVYLSMSESLDRVVDSLKYMVKTF